MCNSLKHLAFILDGNRRWAKGKGSPGTAGHKSGYETVKKITDLLPEYGVKYVTYYAFSTENWKRSQEEIGYLFSLFRQTFGTDDYFNERGFRFIHIGDISKFPKDIADRILSLEEATKDNNRLTVVVAVNYGGRDEIVRAVKRIAQDISDHKCCISDITEDVFSSYLDTNGIPYPDAIVRTSEKRISNFLIWQLAYSEVFFLDKYWPDFNENDLKVIVNEFSQRKRRYGG